MNPLFATCGIGLLSMTVGAALTPDVLPTPVLPPAIESTTTVTEAAVPDAPLRPPTVTEREPIRIDPEMFSRRALPSVEIEDLRHALLEKQAKEEAALTLSSSALEARIRDNLMTPLNRRSVAARNFSRVQLPRTDFQYELDPTDPMRLKAPKTKWVAFRVTRSHERRPLDKPELIAHGRIHEMNGTIEVRFVADKDEVWHPVEKALGRLARLR
ncbi:MAG: hypothetical protein QNJ98_18785 [Planctomycetota bacterium]|nr:hypothetical protein [Planctomycetota bacterium]